MDNILVDRCRLIDLAHISSDMSRSFPEMSSAHQSWLIRNAYLQDKLVTIHASERPAAYAIFDQREDTLWISYLAVIENFRGHGLGNALLETMEKTCKERGCKRIALSVKKYNQRAINFYQKHGYSYSSEAGKNKKPILSKEVPLLQATTTVSRRIRPKRNIFIRAWTKAAFYVLLNARKNGAALLAILVAGGCVVYCTINDI